MKRNTYLVQLLYGTDVRWGETVDATNEVYALMLALDRANIPAWCINDKNFAVKIGLRQIGLDNPLNV